MMIKLFIIGFIFISVIGTLLHFTYDYSHHNKIVGLFSAVNESIWEHMKIAITPYFLWALVDGFIYGNYYNYFFAKLVGIISIIVLIPLLAYLYNLISKKHILILDIIIFYVAIFCGQYFSYLILNINKLPYYIIYISLILLFIIFGFYMVATLFPLKTSLFLDPITKEYGLKGHGHVKKKNKN